MLVGWNEILGVGLGVGIGVGVNEIAQVFMLTCYVVRVCEEGREEVHWPSAGRPQVESRGCTTP